MPGSKSLIGSHRVLRKVHWTHPVVQHLANMQTHTSTIIADTGHCSAADAYTCSHNFEYCSAQSLLQRAFAVARARLFSHSPPLRLHQQRRPLQLACFLAPVAHTYMVLQIQSELLAGRPSRSATMCFSSVNDIVCTNCYTWWEAPAELGV